MEMITLKNVSKRYKEKKALDGVSLEIKKGELFGLLGVNGAGKTTLIKILCTLTKKSGGSVCIDGFDLEKEADKIKGIVGISPQETSVANNLTVQENLQFIAGVYQKNNPEKMREIIEVFHLEEVLSQRAKTLSGGYKRRLSIAIALISEPKILFLDEPTLGLDVFARRELWTIIRRLKEKVTIVLTSHYLEEMESLCDRVAILSKGKVLSVGTVEELKHAANCATFEDAFVKLAGDGYERGKNDA